MPGNEVSKVVRGTVAGGRDVARSAGRAVGTARQIGGAGNPGLMRLVDVHAAAAAGDTLVVIGLLTTLFFDQPIDIARGRMALFLLVTMVPFAVVAPLIGPVLDRFRHGRRFAMSASLALRAVLAWVISLYVAGGIWLYVAAFGVVLCSRSYGVARSAALARLVPPSGLRLSQASARAAVLATAAGLAAAAVGGIAASIGPQWALRLASVIFLIGAGIALSLPPLADTEPPEVLARPFGVPWRGRMRGADGAPGASVLSGRLVGVTLIGSAGLRLLYGFLLLFLAFAIRSGSLDGRLLGVIAEQFAQLVFVGAAFGVGTLIATGIGTARRVSRPVRLLATAVVLVALAGIYATVRFSFLSLLVLCLFTAIASGLAKVAVDAAIQERVPEPYRPHAYARTETLLLLVWLAGAAIGLTPYVNLRLGIAAATFAALGAIAVSLATAWRMRGEVLTGQPAPGPNGVVSGVLMHRGTHARQLPPAPVGRPAPPITAAPAPQPLTGAPVSEAPVSEAPVSEAPVVETPVLEARVIEAQHHAGPANPQPQVPPGYHVFRPSPPEEPPASSGTPAG